LPSYSIGYEDGEAEGEARGEAHIVRRLLARLDAGQVAELLGLSRSRVEAIAAQGEPADPGSEARGA
jgi:hypothetical protein